MANKDWTKENWNERMMRQPLLREKLDKIIDALSGGQSFTAAELAAHLGYKCPQTVCIPLIFLARKGRVEKFSRLPDPIPENYDYKTTPTAWRLKQ